MLCRIGGAFYRYTREGFDDKRAAALGTAAWRGSRSLSIVPMMPRELSQKRIG